MSIENGVSIAVCGKFHVLNYIKFLAREENFSRLYMSHKPSTAKDLNLPASKIRNFPAKEYLLRGYSSIFKSFKYEEAIIAVHRLWQSQLLSDWQPAGVLHLLAQGAAPKLPLVARAGGSKILCEVVNTHPDHRLNLMRNEADYWGLPPWRSILLRREKYLLEEIAQADAILAPTRQVAQTFRERGVNVPIHVLPYAANTEKFKPSQENSFSAPNQPLRIISIGQIGLRKGQLHLLQMIPLFGKSIQITLVGKVDPEVAQLVNYYSKSFVHIPRVNPQDMPKVLSQQDVFISTSLEEGLAVSICEAMAMGLAVIATDESGAGEVIESGKSGILIPSKNQNALATAINELIQHRDLVESLGREALKRTRALVNWQIYAERLEKIYEIL